MTLALSTAMRYSEIRLLNWIQVDFAKRILTVGDSKTEAGAAGDNFKPCSYATDPTKPIGDWKEAWEAAKRRTGAILKADSDDKEPQPLVCRFHDLRHTACTRMLERGVPFSVVATIMGWSPSTAVRMARRYGHIGESARREAVQALNGADFGAGVHQIGNQISAGRPATALTN